MRRYPQALTLPSLRVGKEGPNCAKLGSWVRRGTYLGGPARVPASELLELLGAVAEKAYLWLASRRSCHQPPPPRVRPLCEPAALWLGSLAGSGAASAGGEAGERELRPLAPPGGYVLPCGPLGSQDARAGNVGYSHLNARQTPAFRPWLVQDS